MVPKLYNYPVHKNQKIILSTILKNDIIPWLLSSLLALGIFYGVVSLVNSASPDIGIIDSSAYLFSYASVFYYALIVGMCLLARRSKDIWTWILSGVLIIFFVFPHSWTIANVLLPNSIFPAISAMIGFLALGKIIEYIHFKYIMKLKEPKLSILSLAVYTLFVVQAVILNIPYFFVVFNCCSV